MKIAQCSMSFIVNAAQGHIPVIQDGEVVSHPKTVTCPRVTDLPVSKRVRIYYLTQAQVAPPTFVLFTDRAVKLHFSYQRFLENQIRKAFGFIGTPIWIKNRARK